MCKRTSIHDARSPISFPPFLGFSDASIEDFAVPDPAFAMLLRRFAEQTVANFAHLDSDTAADGRSDGDDDGLFFRDNRDS